LDSKGETRAYSNTLPFDILPNRLVLEVVYNAMFCLNCFLHKDGIHATMSPHTLVTGSNINYNKHCKLQFGAYLQVHKQHNNSMLLCTSDDVTPFETEINNITGVHNDITGDVTEVNNITGVLKDDVTTEEMTTSQGCTISQECTESAHITQK
jgi:hypothetical protein